MPILDWMGDHPVIGFILLVGIIYGLSFLFHGGDEMNCPKCNAEMEETPHEPDVGLEGGFYCHACKEFFPGNEFDLDESEGCICGMSSVNSASPEPSYEVINKNCPLHGNEAARDPDAAYERHRDEPPMRIWGEDF